MVIHTTPCPRCGSPWREVTMFQKDGICLGCAADASPSSSRRELDAIIVRRDG